ncbi:metal-dependent hydrolase [Pseudoblastomonas halimionae]|uniref:Metal-dependent hydrolase n=1 Tax=Alteriqipengyuania halimionae TaxID=1926630 RepID=A0A6I4TZG7_9SPHN|nr:metal-dependent hydrolase [Alteriqipengyuania halimionae]MXP09249.1 metal-dependent hydrolase [Alteriqipengyuania halimionae]
MDNLTHSLVGAVIGQAGLKKKTGLGMAALIIGANLPDVDAACFLWLDGVEHLAFRRGITHGPIAWVLLPLLLAGALWWFDRWQARRGKRPEGRLPVHFGWLYALSFIGCLTHPALDWLNVYGIRLLEPFSHRWFYGDVLFIIDVWLWAILGIGLWLSLRQEKRGRNWRRTAQIAGAVGLAYIGMNAAIAVKSENDALTFYDNYPGIDAIGSPVPLAIWKREIIWYAPGSDVETASPVSGQWTLASGLSKEMTSLQAKVVWIEDGADPPVSAVELAVGDRQLAAFIFWSRTPFVECSSGGKILVRDARYYDPRARDRFTVAMPDVECEPLP